MKRGEKVNLVRWSEFIGVRLPSSLLNPLAVATVSVGASSLPIEKYLCQSPTSTVSSSNSIISHKKRDPTISKIPPKCPEWRYPYISHPGPSMHCGVWINLELKQISQKLMLGYVQIAFTHIRDGRGFNPSKLDKPTLRSGDSKPTDLMSTPEF